MTTNRQFHSTVLAVVLAMVCCAPGVRCLAAESSGKSASVLLGDPAFQPSPEHPIGWRGDGTGRFPAANPPTQWGRTIKGFYAELRCQAGKPSGPAKAGELLNMGFLRDWLIIGQDPAQRQ